MRCDARVRSFWIAAAWLGALAAAACNREDLNDGPPIVKAVAAEPEPPAGTPQDVRLNELVVFNQSHTDGAGGTPASWIEFYNPKDVAIDLAGIWLTDDILEADKWVFPGGGRSVIPARGFLVVFADGSAGPDPDPNDLVATFDLTAYITAKITYDGRRGTESMKVRVSTVGPDQSVGRYPDGEGDAVPLKSSTPGAANAEPGAPVNPPPGPGGGDPPKEGNFIRGELNGDGEVDFADALLISKIATGAEPAPACADRADANDDGAISAEDFNFLSRYLFLREGRIPAPYPAAGTDPTSDSLACPGS